MAKQKAVSSMRSPQPKLLATLSSARCLIDSSSAEESGLIQDGNPFQGQETQQKQVLVYFTNRDTGVPNQS